MDIMILILSLWLRDINMDYLGILVYMTWNVNSF